MLGAGPGHSAACRTHSRLSTRGDVCCRNSSRGSSRQPSGARYPPGVTDVGTNMLTAPKLLLRDEERQRLDESPDDAFYATPRMMQHAGSAFVDALQRVYSQALPVGACVLELCASHASHLPPGLQPRLVVGQGMNGQELAANAALRRWFVQDLNAQPLLREQLDASYDAVLCVNGAQYLTQLETVMAEASRVLRPGGVCILAFGPDCFREKAWAGWLSRSMAERTTLLQRVLQANGFDAPLVMDAAAAQAAGCDMRVLVAGKPRFWSAGAADADAAAAATEVRADNVQQWFSKPALSGLAEAAAAAGGEQQQQQQQQQPQQSRDARLLEQWRAAYESMTADAVELGIPRSVVPRLAADASAADMQAAVQHLQDMMASFLSAGL